VPVYKEMTDIPSGVTEKDKTINGKDVLVGL
jgi:hypothetical protein